jgi:AsmA protein
MIDTDDAPAPSPAPTPAPAPVPPRRRRTGRRILLVLVLIVIVLPVAAAVAAFLTFNPNAYKTRIAAAVTQATGRDVTFAGPLAIKLSWVPTLTARDVRLDNIPGGSSPEMAHIDEIDTRIALLPMLRHRIEIQDLVLRHPTVLLERTADGRPNWLFQAPPATGPSSPQPATVTTSAGPWHVAIDSLEIVDGQFTYRNGTSGTSASLAVPHADFSAQVNGNAAPASPASGPLAVSVDAVWQGLPIGLSGTTGPLAHLTDPADRSSWPLDLTLSAKGAVLEATGSATDPRAARGYALDLHGTVAALEALTPLLPPRLQASLQAQQLSLPQVHGIAMSAHIADAGQGAPRLSNLSLQAQGSDLGATLPGLKLDSLSMITPALDQPATVDILGERNGLAFTLSGSLGPLAALLQPKAPLPVDLVLTSAQSNLHMQGSIAQPWNLRGLNLGLAVQIADLGRLSPLAGTALPPIASLSGSGTLSDMPLGLGQGLLLTGLDLTAPQGDLEGAAGIDYGGRPMVTADLRSARLDLDALLGLAPAPVAPSAMPAPAGLPPPPPPAAVLPPVAAPPAAGPPRRLVIPNLPLPVARLRSFDAKVNLAFASLRLDGVEYRALVTQLSLLHGLLSLAPSSVVVPGGEMVAAGQLDARGDTPHAAVSMQAPNLAIAPLLGALQVPAAANGLVQVFANLTGSGATTRALAASVSGSVGIAAVNGVIDGRALAALIRPAVQATRVIPPELLAAAGQIPLRCLALRLDATNGVGAVNALVLDTSALLLQGSGSVNFGQESLALSLQPNLHLGATELTVPLTLGGSFANPHLGKVGSVVISERTDAGRGINGLFQSLIGGKHRAPPVSPACAPALVLARNGLPGPAPVDGDAGLLGKPIDLLQQFLHGQ